METIAANSRRIEKHAVRAALPIEKKLIGWSLGLGVVLLFVLIFVSRTYFRRDPLLPVAHSCKRAALLVRGSGCGAAHAQQTMWPFWRAV